MRDQLNSFHRVTSVTSSLHKVAHRYDHLFSLGDLIVMGHSGQPVEDILRCSMLSTPLDALTMSLEALHLAPNQGQRSFSYCRVS